MSDSGKARRAIVIGAAGQDGIHLTLHLAGLGYEVLRVTRNSITHVDGETQPFDILDSGQSMQLLKSAQPREIYYLAAHHHSAEEAETNPAEVALRSMRVHFDGWVNVLESVRSESPTTRAFLASSVLVYGELGESPQSETTPMVPNTPYGISKLAAMGACRTYREQYGVYAACGILFNHDSPLRPASFVSRKIARAAVAASRNAVVHLSLGSLDVELDWSAAADIVRAMHLVLELDDPDDFVIASGELHSVREFAHIAFDQFGLNYEDYVTVDSSILRRPNGSVPRLGDIGRLRRATGYQPQIAFQQLVRDMVSAELMVQ